MSATNARREQPGGNPVGPALPCTSSLAGARPRVKFYGWRVLLALWIAPKMEYPYLLGLHEAMKSEPKRLGLADDATFLQIVERMMALEAEGYTKIVLSPAHRATADRWERQHEGVNSGLEAHALLHFLQHDKYYEVAT